MIAIAVGIVGLALWVPVWLLFVVINAVINSVSHGVASKKASQEAARWTAHTAELQARAQKEWEFFEQKKSVALENIYVAENALLTSGIASPEFITDLETKFQNALIAYDDIVPGSISFRN